MTPPPKRRPGRPPRRETPSDKGRITVPLTRDERATANERAAKRGLKTAEAVRRAMRGDKLID